MIEVRRRWKNVPRIILDRLLTGIGVLIYYIGLDRLMIHLNRRSPKVLMYHACEPTESDFIRGLSINTTPGQLAAHLLYLTRHYRVVPLAELWAASPAGPTAALTFDDGFRSVYENAWPRLRERELSATCYLTTGVIGNNASIWLYELNWFLHSQPQMARAIISAWLGRDQACSPAVICRSLIEQYDPAKIEELLCNLRAKIGVDGRLLARTHRPYLEWDQIAEMSAAGISFGNHTCSHVPLALLAPEACREEIRGACSALAHLPGATESLAYPFGSRTEETRRVALELGIQSLLEVEGVNSPLDPTRIGRIKVGSDSVAVLFARMEIVEPIKSRLKRWLRHLGFRSGPGGS